MHPSGSTGVPPPEPFPPITSEPGQPVPEPEQPIIDPEKGVVHPVKLPGDPEQPSQKRT
jgi:hypothetical protein